jgi:hypothetical protein
MQRGLIYITTILSIFIITIGCSTKGMESYEPKTPDEEAIISVLSKYQKTRRSVDIEGCMAVLHDDGKFMWGRYGAVVSKADFKKRMPALFSDMTLNTPESINVSGNTAQVETLVRIRAVGRYFYSMWTIDLVEENNQWLIMSWTYPRL